MTARTLAGAALLAGVTLAALAVAAPAPTDAVENVKERAGFIPQRKYQPVPGKVVGVLVADVVGMMGQEGRSGPPDAFGFSRGGGSYNWVYVPVKDRALITNFRVKAGETGDQEKVYPSLSMANAQTVKQWNVPGGNVLVEVEVCDGLGAPAGEGFVATKMKVVEGTKDYPLKVADVLQQLRKRYQTWRTEHQKDLDAALAEAKTNAIKDEKATGPRETNDLLYVSWLPDKERLVVRFRTKVTDGAYKYTDGGAFGGPRPLPPGGPARLPPPPPRQIKVRYGTTFGIEYGMAYEVSKTGTVEKTLALPAKAFKQVLPPPPAVDRRGPFPLPPNKR